MRKRKTREQLKAQLRKKRFDGLNLRLKAEKRSGYVRRWVNDIGDRLERLQDMGWTFVEDKDASGSDDPGTRRKKNVGVKERGGAQTAYLMEIPEETYEAIQEIKQEEIDEVEAQIQSGALKEESQDKRYVPKGGISIRKG